MLTLESRVATSLAALEIRRDNFDALRLLAAIVVLVGHGFVLTGSRPVPSVLGVPVHIIGLSVFFVISGYLISGSWQAGGGSARFLWHRVLRIFPALIVVIAVTVFVVGPLASTVDLGPYFASGETWRYLGNVSLVMTYDLPGVFRTHPTTAVNGSLWTLGVEFCCYLSVLGIGHASIRLRPVVWVAVLVVAAGISLTTGAAAATMVTFFAMGALAKLVAPRRLFRPRVAFEVALGCLVLHLLVPGATQVLAWIVIPWIALTIGFASTPGLRGIGRIGDLSYGVYLWAYLVQQMVIAVAPGLPVMSSILATLVLTLGVAGVSWRFIERPALDLKPRTPFRPWVQAPSRAIT